MKAKNEVRVYLKQEIKNKLDYLAGLMNMPTSKLLRIMIEEPVFIQTINTSISMVEAVRKQQANDSKQMEFDLYGDNNTKV